MELDGGSATIFITLEPIALAASGAT